MIGFDEAKDEPCALLPACGVPKVEVQGSLPMVSSVHNVPLEVVQAVDAGGSLEVDEAIQSSRYNVNHAFDLGFPDLPEDRNLVLGFSGELLGVVLAEDLGASLGNDDLFLGGNDLSRHALRIPPFSRLLGSVVHIGANRYKRF